MRRITWMTLSMMSITLLGLIGCDGGGPPSGTAPSSRTEAKVSGTVKINGKPMTEGEVTFDPSNVNRKDAVARSAKIDEKGHYEITTLVGPNQISVKGKAISSDPKLGYVTRSLDVQSGDNPFDITAP